MGFLRRLFGAKNSTTTTTYSSSSSKQKRRWSFTKSTNSLPNSKREPLQAQYDDNSDATKHAIAVAAATAAVAEAALAAAHAAAEVVRLTGGGSGGVGGLGRFTSTVTVRGCQRTAAAEVVAAAVKIQSAFRAYLARRALRALKALVKLQALVRGHIVRKQTAEMLRRMQTLVRLQARARATRSNSSQSHNSRYAVLATPYKDRLPYASGAKYDGTSILKRCGSSSNFRDISDLGEAKLSSNWLDRWMEESVWKDQVITTHTNRKADDEKSDKILEVDTWKPQMKSKRSDKTFQTRHHSLVSDKFALDSPSKLSTKEYSAMLNLGEVSSLSSLKMPLDNSPYGLSTSSRPGSSGRRGPFTPARSECPWSCFTGYMGYPNYMANTESSRAKVRSQSAPRQRLEFEKYGYGKRSFQGFPDIDTISERAYVQHSEFRSKAYQPSSCLNKVTSTNLS